MWYLLRKFHAVLPQVIMKSAAEEDINARVRRIWLAEALVAFSQGIAFFHAGDEILRSKSLDRDSYNSGHRLTPAKPNALCLWKMGFFQH